MAMRGASGPNTAPRQSVAREAMMIPGRSIAATVPPVLKPSAGLWPAVPGRYVKVRATSRPLSTRGRIGHQAGVPLNPRSLGSVVNTNVWDFETNAR